MIKKFTSINESIDKRIEAKYVYEKYSKDESNRQDYEINSIQEYSYVEIQLNNKNELSEEFVKNHIGSILKDKNVSKNNLDIFNKSEDVFKYRTNCYLENKNIDVLTKILTVDQNLGDTLAQNVNSVYDTRFLSNNITPKYFSIILSDEDLKSDNFFKNSIMKDILKYKETIFDYTHDTYTYLDEIPYYNIVKKSCNSFYSKVISEEESQDNNIYRAGVFIEKFLNIGEEIKYLTSYYEPEEDIIFDKNVSYGQTYSYTLRDVFIFEYIDLNDPRVKNYCFICGVPYYTGDIKCENKILPAIPDGITFSKVSEGIKINWNIPKYGQDNIKGIQVLKRESVDDAFEVIVQLESHEYYDYNVQSETVQDNLIIRNPGHEFTEFVDKSFSKSKNQIYAIRSIASTGEKSNYSEQVLVYYDYLNDKVYTEVVAFRGCPVFYPNIYLSSNSKYFKKEDEIISTGIIKNISKIKVYITPEYEKLNNDTNVLDNEDYKFELYNMSRNKKFDYNFKITNL